MTPQSGTPTSDPQEPADEVRTPALAAAWNALIDDLRAEVDQGDMHVFRVVWDHIPEIERAAALADARPDAALREWVGLHAVYADKMPWGTTVVDAEELDAFLAAASPDSAPAGLDPKNVGRIIDEHYRARRAADPNGPPLHECGSYCGTDIAARLGEVALDAAWTQATAALPDGWCDLMVYHYDPKPGDVHVEGHYGAKTANPNTGGETYGYGETPAAALLDLSVVCRTLVPDGLEHRMGPPRWEVGLAQDEWANRCVACKQLWPCTAARLRATPASTTGPGAEG